MLNCTAVVINFVFVNLFLINGIFFLTKATGFQGSLYKFFSLQCLNMIFFSASVWSIQIKAIAVLWYTVNFKSKVVNVVLTF